MRKLPRDLPHANDNLPFNFRIKMQAHRERLHLMIEKRHLQEEGLTALPVPSLRSIIRRLRRQRGPDTSW